MGIKAPPPIKHKPTVIAFPAPKRAGSKRASGHPEKVHYDVPVAKILGESTPKPTKADRYGDVPPNIRSTRHTSAISSAHRDLTRIKDPALRQIIKDIFKSWDEGAKKDPEALAAILLGKRDKGIT